MAPGKDPDRVRPALRLSPGRPAPLLLAGPTASGKSAVALVLAETLGGEIVTVDSMQVYRGLDIGTAKPSAGDRARVPHHLLDLVEPHEAFDAARWLEAACAAEAGIREPGRVPIFCGGTGFYFRAWMEGLPEGPPPDPARRAILEATPLDRLLAELEAGDPATRATVDPRNPRRVVRAVERLRDSVRPGAAPAVPPGPGRSADASADRSGADGVVVVLRREADDLRRRIDARVEAMFADGLVGETRRLLERGLDRNRTAMQAIGYRQVVEHLRGERDVAATVALVKSKTWQYARRQMTWFRHQLRVAWLEVPAGEAPEVTAGRVRREFGPGLGG